MKLVDVVGARPQFIKVTPVLRAIERHNREHPNSQIYEVLVHTGQHYDSGMSQVFFEELSLKTPDHHLGVGSGTHACQTGEMLKRLEHVLLQEMPDVVVVYGDTNSTLAGALAAAKLCVPVAHVEAPTETAVDNLRREGISRCVYLVGNVTYDAVLQLAVLAEWKSRILEHLGLAPQAYALATVHRAENTDHPERLCSILQGLNRVAREGLPIVVPLRPRTRKAVLSLGLEVGDLRVIDPVSYLDMLLLEKHARVIITDSGGVQKEAFFFRVPCVTLRDETEWPETVEAGWNVLVGCDPERIAEAARAAAPGREIGNLYGNGRAAELIVSCLQGRIRS